MSPQDTGAESGASKTEHVLLTFHDPVKEQDVRMAIEPVEDGDHGENWKIVTELRTEESDWYVTDTSWSEEHPRQ